MNHQTMVGDRQVQAGSPVSGRGEREGQPVAAYVEDAYPLSPVQHGMLLHWLGAPHAGVDIEQMVGSLNEDLDVAAMQWAWQRVVDRHPVLRSRFRWKGLEEPLQEVMSRAEIRLDRRDLRGASPTEQARHFDDFLRADRWQGFDPNDPPLMRLTLFQMGDTHYRLVWTFHHGVLDGNSFPAVVKEVFAFYEARRGGRDLKVPLPRRYRDHIFWLRREIATKSEKAAAFWRPALAGFTAPTTLTAAQRPGGATPDGPGHGEQEIRLSLRVSSILRALAEQHRLTVSTFVHGAWAMILGGYSGAEDVVFGVTRACRRSGLPEAADMVGIFINTLPVRANVSGDALLLPWLSDLRERQQPVHEFEHTPLSDVQAASDIPWGTPLFETVIVFNGSQLGVGMRGQGDGWENRDFRWLERTGFPVTLFAYAAPEIVFKLSYDRRRFDDAAMARVATELRTLLTAMADDPGARLADLPRISEQERRQILIEWNRTAADYEKGRCIHELFEAQAQQTPDAPAVVFRDEELTYRELDRRADALARELRALGVGPEVMVGICVERSIEMVVGLLGILKAGGAYVPLDPHYPRERLAMVLEDTKAKVLLTQQRLASGLPARQARVVLLDAAPGAAPGAPASEALRSKVTPEDLAYVLFISGSTGRPKGVMVQHRSVINLFAGMDERLGYRDAARDAGVWLAVTSISLDLSVVELFWTLTRGFKVVIQQEDERAALAARAARPAPARQGMQFGLFYFAADAGDAADARETGDRRYRLLIEGARYADQHGFSAVWTPERHFHAFGGLYPNPSVTGAALAMITERIQIRAGSVVLPLHDPIRIAEEWAMVDNLSRGRVGISFASGWHTDDFVLSPENFADRKEIMVRGIDTVRKLWRGEFIPARSGDGAEVMVRTLPAPVQAELPFWVTAAGNPETYRLAGALGANCLTNLLGHKFEDLAAKIAIYRAARREHGHEGPGCVSLMLHTFVGADLAEVRAKVKKPFIEYLKTSTDLLDQARPEEMDMLVERAFDRYFKSSGLFGTVDVCLAMVGRLAAIGVDEIACLVDFGVDADAVLESLPYLNQVRERSRAAPAEETEDYTLPAQIRRHRVTHLQSTPSMVRRLAATAEGLESLRPLKRLLLGGEALPAALVEQLAPVVEGEILNLYGPTEATVWSTTATVGKHGEPITIGRPIVNTEIYILDRHRQPTPIGVPGELFIGGAGVARGYLNRPELTAERFIRSPFRRGSQGRLYRTGDLARYRPDGSIEFLGRADQQVKIGGYRVELGEIEAVLGAHPGVHECAVVVREGPPGEPRLCAYVVPRADSLLRGIPEPRPSEPSRNGIASEQSPPTLRSQRLPGGSLSERGLMRSPLARSSPTGASAELEAHLRVYLQARLPDFMVPSAIVFLGALPLTPSGKIDRAPPRDTAGSGVRSGSSKVSAGARACHSVR